MIQSTSSSMPRQRWWWAALTVAVTIGMIAVFALVRQAPPPKMSTRQASVASAAAGSSAADRPATLSAGSPDPLQLAGPVPTHGSGHFAYAVGTGPRLGTAGPVRRFHVAVERGSGADVASFAATVDSTLGDRQSWIGAGSFRLQRVPAGVSAEFTVFLATRQTAGRMCAAGGIDIEQGGAPYTSCRTPGHAIINLDRWRRSAAPYVAARVPLAVYRQYVINHEVGHQLGHQHEGCPKLGGRAPVMMQQTLSLRGCRANPWPRPNGHSLTGPPV